MVAATSAPDMIVRVDKADAKALIAEKVGGQYVIPTLWVGTDLASVDWSAIALPAVVKPTHASGVGRFLYGEADVDRSSGAIPRPNGWRSIMPPTTESGLTASWSGAFS